MSNIGIQRQPRSTSMGAENSKQKEKSGIWNDLCPALSTCTGSFDPVHVDNSINAKSTA